MRAESAPMRAADRVEFVDMLRGFALLGVFAANLLIFSGYTYMTDAQRAMLPTARPDGVVYLLELIFVENKFLGLFSFLFGVSFWLFLDRANARGADGARLFYRRLDGFSSSVRYTDGSSGASTYYGSMRCGGCSCPCFCGYHTISC